jgi:hypothetical protein
MRYYLLSAIIFYFSCVPEVTDQLATVDQQPPNAADFNQVNYQPLFTDKVINADINEKCPVYQFLNGKSYVKAFSLPAVRPLEVASLKETGGVRLKNVITFTVTESDW